MERITIQDAAKDRLEGVLDEYFPKIEEEGEEKRLNKRGPALVLLGQALVEIRKVVTAFGGCEWCFGKGYGTETTFSSSRGSHTQMPPIVPCTHCERGAQLRGLLAPHPLTYE